MQIIISKIMSLPVNVQVVKVHILNSKLNRLKEKTLSVLNTVIITSQIQIIHLKLVKK